MLIPAWLFIENLVSPARKHALTWFMLLTGIVILVPWLYGNIMACGYLVFPVTATGFFDVDWKMTPERMQWIIDMNTWWPRAPFEPLEISMKYSMREWFPKWLHSQDFFSLALLSAFILLTLSTAATLVFARKRIAAHPLFNPRAILVLICTYLAIVLWYTNGPTPRFIFGYAVFTVSFYIAIHRDLFLSTMQLRPAESLFRSMVLLAWLGGSFIFVKTNYTSHTFATALLVPRPYSHVDLEKLPIGGGEINRPTGDGQCWDAPLPCSNLPETGLEMRGRDIEDGYRVRN
jgi:hypothetical protein